MSIPLKTGYKIETIPYSGKHLSGILKKKLNEKKTKNEIAKNIFLEKR